MTFTPTTFVPTTAEEKVTGATAAVEQGFFEENEENGESEENGENGESEESEENGENEENETSAIPDAVLQELEARLQAREP